MFKDSYDFSNINSVKMRYSTNFGYLFNKLISSDLNFTKRTSTSTFSYTFENLRFGGPYLYVLKTPLQSCHLLVSFLCHMRRREVKPSHVWFIWGISEYMVPTSHHSSFWFSLCFSCSIYFSVSSPSILASVCSFLRCSSSLMVSYIFTLYFYLFNHS